MTIQHGWNKAGERTTTIVASADNATGWVLWNNTNGQMANLDQCRWGFRSLISLARDLQDDLTDGEPIKDPVDFCRVHSFWNWEASCRGFVKNNLPKLRASRAKISTPVDYAGTTTTSFCELAMNQMKPLIQYFWHFVTSPIDPVKQIRAGLAEGRQPKFARLHADDLLRLVNIELDGCDWGQPVLDELDSDFTEPLPKSFVAESFGRSVDWLREQIDAGAIRVHSETTRTAKTVRFHIDTVPMLKMPHERARLLAAFRKRKAD